MQACQDRKTFRVVSCNHPLSTIEPFDQSDYPTPIRRSIQHSKLIGFCHSEAWPACSVTARPTRISGLTSSCFPLLCKAGSGCPSLRALDEHSFIVRVLRARGTADCALAQFTTHHKRGWACRSSTARVQRAHFYNAPTELVHFLSSGRTAGLVPPAPVERGPSEGAPSGCMFL